MYTYKIRTLELHDNHQRRIDNKFFQQEQSSDTLAVILPGARYTCDMPLLYYATEIITQRGADVLQLWADYTGPDFQAGSSEERVRQLQTDAQALIEAGQSQGDYERLILAGKSIGTITMAGLVSENKLPAQSVSIWFTPLLHIPQVVEAVKQLRGPALMIGGSADKSYEQDGLAQIRGLPNVRTIIIDGSDHSLEIPGNWKQSIDIIEKVGQQIDRFLENMA